MRSPTAAGNAPNATAAAAGAAAGPMARRELPAEDSDEEWLLPGSKDNIGADAEAKAAAVDAESQLLSLRARVQARREAAAAAQTEKVAAMKAKAAALAGGDPSAGEISRAPNATAAASPVRPARERRAPPTPEATQKWNEVLVSHKS